MLPSLVPVREEDSSIVRDEEEEEDVSDCDCDCDC